MAERMDDRRLSKLREDGKKIYSISRLNTINQCNYQAYLNYVEHINGKNVGIYGILGGKCHDAIENCLLGTGTEEDIKKAIIQELEDCEMCGVEFPKGRDGSESIKNNWVTNMTRFAEEFKTPKGEFKTEELLLYPIDETHYMMGYADAIRFDNDGVWLIDWKTSSNFDKNHTLVAGRQLILYKLALEKLGYTVKRCSWCMMKYCETSYSLKNGKTKKKVSEWRNLIKDLSDVIEKKMLELGYDEIDTEIAIKEGVASNRWDSFPEDIRNHFKTTIYVRDYDITPDLEEETLDYIKKSINLFETLKEWKPCDINKESFFCNSLCNFGGKSGQCKYYVDYCNSFSESSDEDLF